jgi:hypothetical protein
VTVEAEKFTSSETQCQPRKNRVVYDDFDRELAIRLKDQIYDLDIELDTIHSPIDKECERLRACVQRRNDIAAQFERLIQKQRAAE